MSNEALAMIKQNLANGRNGGSVSLGDGVDNNARFKQRESKGIPVDSEGARAAREKEGMDYSNDKGPKPKGLFKPELSTDIDTLEHMSFIELVKLKKRVDQILQENFKELKELMGE